MIEFKFAGSIPINGLCEMVFMDKFGDTIVWTMPEEEVDKFYELITPWINKYIEWRIVPCTCDGMPKYDDMPLTEED